MTEVDPKLVSQNDTALEEGTFPSWLRVGFWVCVVIAVAVAVRRVVALASPSQSAPPQMAALNTIFASHAALTLAHVLFALAFVLLAPFALSRRFGGRKGVERAFLVLGLVVGATAYGMSISTAVGGWIERCAVLLFDTIFLFSLLRAYWYGSRNEPLLKRRWLIRSVAVLLGIATTRPVMGVFFATAQLTHLTPHQFFGIAFWIGFSINTLIIELWLRSLDSRLRTNPTRLQPSH